MANNNAIEPLDAIHKFISFTNIKEVISTSFRNGIKPLPHPISENNIRTIVFQAAHGGRLSPALQFNNFTQMFIVVDTIGVSKQETGFLKYDRKNLTTKGIIINDIWVGPGSFSPKLISQENANNGLEKIKHTFPDLGISPYVAIFSVYRNLQSLDIIYDYTLKNRNGECADYLYDTKTKIASFGMAGTSCHFTLPPSPSVLNHYFL